MADPTKDAPKKPGFRMQEAEYDAKFRKPRSRVAKFFNKGIDTVYRASAISRTHPIRRRTTIAAAAGGVLLGPGVGWLSDLAGASVGAAVPNTIAQFLPDREHNLTDTAPPYQGRNSTFLRNDTIAQQDGKAVADIALYVTTDPEMRSARANWQDLSLGERKAVMKKVHDRFVGNYPGAETAEITYIYNAPIVGKDDKGKETKRVMGGAYMLCDEDEIPFIAKVLVGSSYFKKRVMMNAHVASDDFFGGFDGMVDIVVHESTHHLQRVMGKQARNKLRDAGVPERFFDRSTARNHNEADLFWRDQYSQRHRTELRTIRQYMTQPIEGQAFSNGNMARALATRLRQVDAATRQKLQGQQATLGKSLMRGLAFEPTWLPEIGKTLPGYHQDRLLPGADPAILGKPDSFKPLMDAAIAETLKLMPKTGPRP
ncbi:MAG: hypothetical protein Alpg2KO_01490 [Alphaproteobacteria bacterium]